jgi:hypothetical protein
VVAITRLPYSIASGAHVSFLPDVAKNTSQSGISGRLQMRPILRNYMLTVGLDDSDEIVKIIMLGGRSPFGLRDYASNYKLVDQVIPHTGTVALIGKTWAPATGGVSVFERILIPDTTETPFVVKVNGISTAYTFSDFGKVNIAGLTGTDTVTVSGHYLIPVCFVDAPSTSIILDRNGVALHKFDDMRLEQIFETELIRLTA